MNQAGLGVPFDDIIADDFRDDTFALEFLNDALSEDDPRMFLLALGQVAKARKVNLSALARETSLNRRGLYNILSSDGNPEWGTLAPLLKALGFQITLKKTA